MVDGTTSTAKTLKSGAKPKPGAADYLSGNAKTFVRDLSPFLPQELIGGSVPHVPGTEEEAVWNAAAQACGTERVHYCYTVDEKRVWYLACPSSSLASNPDSWCPIAAALPGNSEYWDRETVYLYDAEGMASALRWDPEIGRMQVFLGASRTILPRVQSLDANFVTISPDQADIVPWRSRQLNTEKLTRAMLRTLIFTGLAVFLLSALTLASAFMAVNMIKRDMSTVKTRTDEAAMDMMIKASNIMQSDTIKHMVRIQELLDSLANVDGTLVKYEVEGNKTEWQALIPPAFAQDFGKPVGLAKDGRARVSGTK
jgi:hypothetical protein